MIGKINRRRFLQTVGAAGLTSGIVSSSVGASPTEKVVSVTDIGVIHEFNVDAPEGYYPSSYARDQHTPYETYEGKFIIDDNTPNQIKRRVRSTNRVFRGDSLQTQGVDLNSLEHKYIPVRVSPTYSGTTFVKPNSALPAPEGKVIPSNGGKSVIVQGDSLKVPDSGIRLSKMEAKNVPAGSFETQVEVTMLDEDYNRETTWADATVKRRILVANRGELDVIDIGQRHQ